MPWWRCKCYSRMSEVVSILTRVGEVDGYEMLTRKRSTVYIWACGRG